MVIGSREGTRVLRSQRRTGDRLWEGAEGGRLWTRRLSRALREVQVAGAASRAASRVCRWEAGRGRALGAQEPGGGATPGCSGSAWFELCGCWSWVRRGCCRSMRSFSCVQREATEAHCDGSQSEYGGADDLVILGGVSV